MIYRSIYNRKIYSIRFLNVKRLVPSQRFTFQDTLHHYTFVHEDRDIAVLGDAVFGSDLRGLPAGHFILPPGIYSEDLNQADEALETLLSFEFEIALLYPGRQLLRMHTRN